MVKPSDVCMVVKTSHAFFRGKVCTVVGVDEGARLPLLLQFRDGLKARGHPHNVIVLARGKTRAAA